MKKLLLTVLFAGLSASSLIQARNFAVEATMAAAKEATSKAWTNYGSKMAETTINRTKSLWSLASRNEKLATAVTATGATSVVAENKLGFVGRISEHLKQQNTTATLPISPNQQQIKQATQNGQKAISTVKSWASTALPHLATIGGLGTAVGMGYYIKNGNNNQDKFERAGKCAAISTAALGLYNVANHGYESIPYKIYETLQNAGKTLLSNDTTSLVGMTGATAALIALIHYRQQIWAHCPTGQQVLDGFYAPFKHAYNNPKNAAKIAGIAGAALGANWLIRDEKSIVSHLCNNPSGKGIMPCLLDNVTAPIWPIVDMFKRIPQIVKETAQATPGTSSETTANSSAQSGSLWDFLYDSVKNPQAELDKLKN